MKPVALCAYPVQNSSASNSIVLDPFGGSGSTAALKEKPMVTLEHFQRAMEGVSIPGIDIDYEQETITFKLGPGGDNPDKVEAAINRAC